MMLDATTSNFEWLAERLYAMGRELQASGVANPTFVLLTQNVQDRWRVEKALLDYLVMKYGLVNNAPMRITESSERITRFYLPQVNAALVLMDVE